MDSKWAGTILHDLGGRAVLLHDVVHDERLAHDVRVQPRRRDPGLAAVVEAVRREGAGQRRDAGRRRGRAHHAARPRSRSTSAPTEAPLIVPTAFYAVVSVAVIGLYLAFLIPIWLRWRMGDAFVPGSWNNGAEVQVDEPRRRHRDRDHLDLLHPAVRARRCALQRRLRLEVRQLRADPHHRLAARAVRSGGRSRRATGSRARSTPSTRRSSRRSASDLGPAGSTDRARPTDRLATALARLSHAGQPSEVTELPGGLTNHNYRVRTATHDVVVRISSADSELLAIDREHEWLNSTAAAAAGVGAPVVDYLPGEGVLVVGFLPGRTYAAARRGVPTCRGVAAAVRAAARRPAVRLAVRHVRGPARLPARSSASAGMPCPRATTRWRRPRRRGRGGAARPPRAARAVPQRPAGRQLPRRRRRPADHRLRVLRHQRGRPSSSATSSTSRGSDHDHLVELVEAYHGRVTDRLLARAELWGLAGRYALDPLGRDPARGVRPRRRLLGLRDGALRAAPRPLLTSRRLDDLLDAAAGDDPGA